MAWLGPRAVPGTHQGTGVNICHALSHAFNSNNRLPEMQVSTSGIKVGQGRGVQNEVVMGARWVPLLTAVRATSLRQTPRTKRGAAEWAPAAEHPRASSHRGHSPRASTRAPGHLSRGSPADVHQQPQFFQGKMLTFPEEWGCFAVRTRQTRPDGACEPLPTLSLPLLTAQTSPLDRDCPPNIGSPHPD